MCPVRQHSYLSSNPCSAAHRIGSGNGNGTSHPHASPRAYYASGNGHANGNGNGNGHSNNNGVHNGSPHRRRSSNIAQHAHSHAHANAAGHARSLSLSRSLSHRSPLVPLPLASNASPRPAMPHSAANSPAVQTVHTNRSARPIILPPPTQLLAHSMSTNTLPTLRVLTMHEPAVPSQLPSIRHQQSSFANPHASFPQSAQTPAIVGSHSPHNHHAFQIRTQSHFIAPQYRLHPTGSQNEMSQAAGNLVNGVKVTRTSLSSGKRRICITRGTRKVDGADIRS